METATIEIESTSKTQATMSLEELEALPEFQSLSDNQMRLVKTFLATGDKAASVRAGYGDHMTREQVRIGVYVYFSSHRVVACIDKIQGIDAKTRLLADLDAMVRNPHVTERQIRAAELKMTALGLKPEPPVELSQEVQAIISKVVRDGIQERLAELSEPKKVEVQE